MAPLGVHSSLVLLVNLLIFWDWLAGKLDHFISILFHVIILHDHRFFFEVPSFEELQDSNSSPRREEVGRHTLGDYGGFLLSCDAACWSCVQRLCSHSTSRGITTSKV